MGADDDRIQKQAYSLRRFIDWGDSAELWADRCHTKRDAFSRLQTRESLASRGPFLNYGLTPLTRPMFARAKAGQTLAILLASLAWFCFDCGRLQEGNEQSIR
jgi:hypothetical protein